jgi:diguanylate cyclase
MIANRSSLSAPRPSPSRRCHARRARVPLPCPFPREYGCAACRRRAVALADCVRCPEAGTPTAPCLLLGDVDDFAALRERLGPARLDEALRQVANTVRSIAQSHHLAARLEDDGFALLIPGAGLHEAYTLAEQLRHGVGQLQADAERRLSLSLGVTQLGGGETARDFLGRADQALRSSRAQGRNRVTVLAADERFAA